jgi:hypothetical protein
VKSGFLYCTKNMVYKLQLLLSVFAYLLEIARFATS